MDYAKIYHDFIESRKARQNCLIVSGRYYERHHIKPLSFGGWKHRSNEVALEYREHLFAHALLVKMQPAGTDLRAQMACAAIALKASARSHGEGRANAAKMWMRYAWIGKIHAAEAKGARHPCHRADTLTLWHIDGRTVTGTRQELITATGLGFRMIYDIANGRRKFSGGWCVSEADAKQRAARGGKRAARRQAS